MIGHKCIGMDVTSIRAGRMPQPDERGEVIAVVGEEGLAVIPALHKVDREFRENTERVRLLMIPRSYPCRQG